MRLHQPIYLLFLFNLFFLAALWQQGSSKLIALFAVFSVFAVFAFKQASPRISR